MQPIRGTYLRLPHVFNSGELFDEEWELLPRIVEVREYLEPGEASNHEAVFPLMPKFIGY